MWGLGKKGDFDLTADSCSEYYNLQRWQQEEDQVRPEDHEPWMEPDCYLQEHSFGAGTSTIYNRAFIDKNAFPNLITWTLNISTHSLTLT